MPRFFIRSLMAFIIVTAVALTALRYANELWAGMMLLVALAGLGTAILAAINLVGRERPGGRDLPCSPGGISSPPSVRCRSSSPRRNG